ncbi:MAG: alanine racemase [Chlamydiales bacterium]|nr:alanine racemase [Chlamydiales bacterium]NCF71242.1 alanine racemase [Chlamydiales bacterium]
MSTSVSSKAILTTPHSKKPKANFWSACLEINLAKIKYNLELIKEHIGKDVRIMPILKSEGYGTCNITLAHFLYELGIDIIGLAYTHEALTLKQAGIKQSIFLVNVIPNEIGICVEHGFEIAVNSIERLKLIEKHSKKLNKRTKVHISLDTGMSRFGAPEEIALELLKYANNADVFEVVGLFSHFAAASEGHEDNFTKQQVTTTLKFINKAKEQGISLPSQTHLCNSSGILRFPSYSFNMVRLGLSMYGIYTSSDSNNILPLKNALTLKAKLIHVRDCLAGDTIGYARTFTAKNSMRIGVVSIGYSDGLHLNYSQKAEVLIHGKLAPYVGRICMDCFMIDLSDIPEASIGDEVIIFGEDQSGNSISPEDLASKGGTIPHELISSLGPRIFRKFILTE